MHRHRTGRHLSGIESCYREKESASQSIKRGFLLERLHHARTRHLRGHYASGQERLNRSVTRRAGLVTRRWIRTAFLFESFNFAARWEGTLLLLLALLLLLKCAQLHSIGKYRAVAPTDG